MAPRAEPPEPPGGDKRVNDPSQWKGGRGSDWQYDEALQMHVDRNAPNEQSNQEAGRDQGNLERSAWSWKGHTSHVSHAQGSSGCQAGDGQQEVRHVP
eukprot:8325461-Heterocapsa_arctica.AAC.1